MPLMLDGKLDVVGAIHNGRWLQNHYPAHFTQIKLNLEFWNSINPAIEWIYKNNSGRFYVDLNQSIIAFEEPGEAVYFAMIKNQFEEEAIAPVF